MKFRDGFVTNSSSSSFICCFARIADKEKAQKFLDQYGYEVEIYTAKEVLENIENNRRWGNWLECDWAGVDITPNKEYIKEHMEDSFVVYESREDLCEDEDGYVNYDIEYEEFSPYILDIVDNISDENGFADIEVGYGAGRDG